MDHGACNVIYLDRRAIDEHVKRNTLSESWAVRSNSTGGTDSPSYFNVGKPRNPAEVLANVEAVLTVFNEVHVCNSGSSCLTKLASFNDNSLESVPTIILIDIPYDEEQRLKRLSREPRTPSPNSMRRPGLDGEPEDLYGIHFLQHVASEIQQKIMSKLVIPVVMLSGLDKELGGPGQISRNHSGSQVLVDSIRLWRYIDAGAVDVYTSPLSKNHVHGLAVHAYKARKEFSREETSFLTSKRNRKVSWVGVDDTKPYAYLREAMVSGLMGGICNPETIGDTLDPNDVIVKEERQQAVASAIGTWEFSAHDYTDDELLYGALLMLQHALSMPELEQWRMDSDELTIMLLASRTAYNDFVLYHNFRHVIDVLQALFFFLVQIGTLPHYPPNATPRRTCPQPAIATLLRPFDALTLLVSAIGHDVGHPGVNNAFLVALNSPLAQLYNDRSVLESFHCAAYSQILRRYWPGAFSDVEMRKLMINSILATDMGLHFKYMTDLGNLQEKLGHNKNSLDGWNSKQCEEYKELLCGLLIKCADISNVARKFSTAAHWARILTDEFSNQGKMEKELNIPTCLFGGPPVHDSVIKMGESQIGFMNIFARPLFEGVSDVLPAMRFSLDEILTNKSIWENKIEAERDIESKKAAAGLLNPGSAHDTVPSPFSEVPTALDTKTQHPRIEAPFATNTSRPASGNFQFQVSTAANGSRRSSLGIISMSERGSRRSSRQWQAAENVSSSRRGSADASITAILVTQKQPSTPDKTKDSGDIAMGRSASPNKKKVGPKRKSRGAEEQHKLRPLSAPAPIGTNPAPAPSDVAKMPPHVELQPNTSQSNPASQSETDLSYSANGSIDPKSPRTWNPGNSPNHDSDGWAANDSEDRNWKGKQTGNKNWSNSWRRDRSKTGETNIHTEAGGYLAPIKSSTSGNSPQGRRKEKSGFGKMWKKIKSLGDREEGEPNASREALSKITLSERPS